MDVQTTTQFLRQPQVVPFARAFVGHALTSAGVEVDTIEALVLAAAEACNNAILHADGDTFTIDVEVAGSTCTLTVRDCGQGFDLPQRVQMPSPEAVDQRGLALMEALVDQVTVSSSAAGTTVVLVHDLPTNGARGRADARSLSRGRASNRVGRPRTT